MIDLTDAERDALMAMIDEYAETRFNAAIAWERVSPGEGRRIDREADKLRRDIRGVLGFEDDER